MIVEPAPRGDAVKVADIFGLRQRHEFVPVQRDRVLYETADLELPLLQRNLGLLTQVEHRPVLHKVLTDGHGGHTVTVAGARSFGFRPLKMDVDRVRAQLALPLDVSLPALHNIGVFGVNHLGFASKFKRIPKRADINGVWS
jgi:hypothetical protein